MLFLESPPSSLHPELGGPGVTDWAEGNLSCNFLPLSGPCFCTEASPTVIRGQKAVVWCHPEEEPLLAAFLLACQLTAQAQNTPSHFLRTEKGSDRTQSSHAGKAEAQ